MLIQHLLYVDGREEHREFSRDSWEDAMRDPQVARQWGHTPERCFDPVKEIHALGNNTSIEVPAPVPRAVLIEEKRAQIRKILEEAQRPAQLTLGLVDGLD